MKLVVGLGNPGREYLLTRHNVGFSLIDSIAKSKGVSFEKQKFNAMYAEFFVNEEKIILVKPLSFMNLSGSVVKKYKDFYKLRLEDILIIQDDLDMKFGRTKVVFDSSSGGHNGIKDIERCLSSKKYFRLKIGISNNRLIETKDYVLGKFGVDEQKKLEDIYCFLTDIVDDFWVLPFEKLMNKYNRK